MSDAPPRNTTLPSARAETLDPFEADVEAGAVRAFARAVMDRTFDPAHPVVPITYPVVLTADHVERLMQRLGLEPGRTVHGEEAFVYEAPLPVGGRVVCLPRLLEDGMIEGRRGGAMRRVAWEVAIADVASGKRLAVKRTVVLEKAPAPPFKDAPPLEGPPHEPRATAGRASAAPDVDRTAQAGRRFGPLTRTDLVRYAGASGDFNPVHHDEPFARAMGLPTVMAHGMLTAGLAASYLAERFGPGAVRAFAVRFREPVFPGDVLAADARILEGGAEGGDDGRSDLALTVVNDRGTVVLTGTATVDRT